MAYSNQESQLRKHLSEVNLYPGDEDMQTIIINSFYVECDMDNDDEWDDKIEYVHKHFDSFQAYALDQWIEDNDPPQYWKWKP